MNRAKAFSQNRLLSCSKIVLACIISVFSFRCIALAQTNPKRDQWIRAGGKLVFSGKHKYKKSDPVDGARKGIITVRGPGLIGLAVRKIGSSGPGMRTLRVKGGVQQSMQALGALARLKGNKGWVWEGEYNDFNPSANAGGWIPPPTRDNPTTALEVRAAIEGGPGALVRNDISIEYEYWFFPREGGGLVSVIEYGPNGEKTDVTAGQPVKLHLDEPGTTTGKQDDTVLYPIADNYVYAYSYLGWNTANWGKYHTLGAGWNPTGGETRAYLKFDLTGINAASVNKAILKLYHFDTGGSDQVDVGVFRVMSPWIEGNGTYKPSTKAAPGELSWVNQPSVDRYPVVYFHTGPGIGKWVEVDVTSLVKAWLKGVPNHGLVIKRGENFPGKPESQYGFRSREFEDVSKRPVLVLSGPGST